QKHINVCQILVAAGANAELKDKSGKTVRDLGLLCDSTGVPNLQKNKQNGHVLGSKATQPNEKISTNSTNHKTKPFSKKSYHNFSVLLKAGDRTESKSPNTKC
ncbi:4192_t:CDS:2, partial [Acaulospora morrowiae]